MCRVRSWVATHISSRCGDVNADSWDLHCDHLWLAAAVFAILEGSNSILSRARRPSCGWHRVSIDGPGRPRGAHARASLQGKEAIPTGDSG
jgi:hypothetical protein